MTSCVEWAPNEIQTGHFVYHVGFPGPDRAQIIAVADVPTQNIASLDPGNEYFLANLLIDHSKTVGPSPCAGCNVPVCIVFQSLKIVTPVTAIYRKLFNGANWQGSLIATWQNGYATNVTTGCSPIGQCGTTFGCTLATPVQTRGSTWGAVKALYR